MNAEYESVLMVDAGCAAILAVVIGVDASPLRVRQICHRFAQFVVTSVCFGSQLMATNERQVKRLFCFCFLCEVFLKGFVIYLTDITFHYFVPILWTIGFHECVLHSFCYLFNVISVRYNKESIFICGPF